MQYVRGNHGRPRRDGHDRCAAAVSGDVRDKIPCESAMSRQLSGMLVGIGRFRPDDQFRVVVLLPAPTTGRKNRKSNHREPSRREQCRRNRRATSPKGGYSQNGTISLRFLLGDAILV